MGGGCFFSHGLLWTVFYCSAELELLLNSRVLQLQKLGWLTQSAFVLCHVYCWKARRDFYIPLCSKESMWSGIWFAQWAKKNRCLLKPWARIRVFSFYQTLPSAHFMASFCVHICGALEKPWALLSIFLRMGVIHVKSRTGVIDVLRLFKPFLFHTCLILPRYLSQVSSQLRPLASTCSWGMRSGMLCSSSRWSCPASITACPRRPLWCSGSTSRTAVTARGIPSAMPTFWAAAWEEAD